MITAGRAAVAVWALLIATAFAWGYAVRTAGLVPLDRLPPLHGQLRLLTWQLLPATATAAAGVIVLPVLARRFTWRSALFAAWSAAVIWAVMLALSEGVAGLTGPVAKADEYLAVLGAVGNDPLGWLRGFTENAQRYPIHVKGHPPLPVLILWALHALGLRGPGCAAALMIGVASSAVPAILMTLKTLAGEDCARRVLPFLALAPYAVWVATSMDALFLGVGAWGIALLARGGRPAWTGAVLLGALPYLSYGLLPLLALPLVVFLAVRPPLTALSGLPVIPLAITVAGFWWPDGVAATLEAYQASGGSSQRPYLYFLVGNVAVLALMIGPAVAHAMPVMSRGIAPLIGAALMGVLALDLSGVTKGEVERIWLPYAAWLMASTVAHVPPARRWLAAQATTGIVLQAVLRSPW